MNQGQRWTIRDLQSMQFAVRADEWMVRCIDSENILPVVTRCYSFLKLISAVEYLRFQNFCGCHIFGRPNSARHVLVDDVDVDAIDRMKGDGLRPACWILTSKANFQVWLTLSRNDDVDPKIAAAAARILAQRYGGDLGAAHRSQLGRLPGFRNRKEIYRDSNGGYPLVRIWHECPGVPPAAAALLEEAQRSAANGHAFRSPSPSSPLPASAPNEATNINPAHSTMTAIEAVDIYRAVAIEVKKALGHGLHEQDRSQLDFQIAWNLAHVCKFDVNDIAAVLWHSSKKANERCEVMPYIWNTINAALRAQ